MVGVVLWTEASRHVNYSVSTITGRPASNLYNESNTKNKFIFKCWSCHAFNVLHQLQSALCFAIFAGEVVAYFWYLSYKMSLKSLTNIFCLLPSFFTRHISKHLRYFGL